MKDRIKELREALGYKQSELAEKLDVNFTTVSKWEKNGNIPERKIQMICRMFGVNENWLKTGEGVMFVNGQPEFNREESDLKSRIKQLRGLLGLTQIEFASGLGLTNGAVTYWERTGNVPTKNIRNIVETFGVNEDWLIEGKGVPFGTQSVQEQETPVSEVGFSETLDERFRKLRLALNMTNKEISEKLNVSEDTINVWIKYGRIPQDKKILICERFNVSLHWLYNGEGEMFNPKTLDGIRNETPREFALRNGCNELTATIFERFINLPDEKKNALIGMIFELASKPSNEVKNICDVVRNGGTSITVNGSVSTKDSTFNF